MSLSGVGHDYEDDANWEELLIKDSSNSPPRKRVRGLIAAESCNFAVRAGIFPALPLDIIFEILELLAPLDLANLAHTSRAFHTTLTSPQAFEIWKRARERMWNAPGCPPRVSETAWAKFIYGEPRCQECGVLSVRKIEFALMRRVCTKCKKKKLMFSGHVAMRLQVYDTAILELIPHTHFGASAQGRATKSKFYWEDDIHAMTRVYGEYQKDMVARKPGAQEAFQKFRDERVKFVAAVAEHAKGCYEWWKTVEKKKYQYAETRAGRRYQELLRRFRELGYDERDIHAIRYDEETNCKSDLTERAWNRVRPILQVSIETARAVRLDRDQTPLINTRKALVKNAYDAYRRTLRPIEWIHLPPAELIYVIPVFRTLIYADLNVPLQQAACDEAARQLPNYISSFKDKLQACLLELMADREYHNAAARRVRRTSGNRKEHLSMANFVFSFWRYGCLCSFEDVTAFLACCCTMIQPQQQPDAEFWINLYEKQGRRRGEWSFDYIPQGRMLVNAMITGLGLDPETARPEDLDRLNRRFICKHCEVSTAYAGPRDLAYSWRTALSHVVSTQGHLVLQTPWRTLTEEESAAVRQAEGVDPAEAQDMWSCNHCAVHLNSLQTYPVVFEHLRVAHVIEEPEENVDLFHALPSARQRPSAQRLSTSLKMGSAS
ncbi:hypothetical protein DAEQUDRAFT_726585 [Daedalea quercina L-15889]|uniref:F-box domain-containing protein n=1 Tax=Daedalea quercina L-15889 TaxID=1314783 RepID=A0A165QKS8_9APHY|nr:hypothetical protein DAEQUDRAFT_726585 [Daedalea quercina L-15889]